MIDYYERGAPKPHSTSSSARLQPWSCQLPISWAASPTRNAPRPGPVSQLERRIEQVKMLERKKQQLVIEFSMQLSALRRRERPEPVSPLT
jgi:hypothetical protein